MAEYERRRYGAETSFYLHADLWSAFEDFCTLFTQWRYIPTFGDPPLHWQGLDYAAVCAWLKLHYPDRKFRIRQMERIQALERGALWKLRGLQLEELLEG